MFYTSFMHGRTFILSRSQHDISRFLSRKIATCKKKATLSIGRLTLISNLITRNLNAVQAIEFIFFFHCTYFHLINHKQLI